jgi:hypothetical protein
MSRSKNRGHERQRRAFNRDQNNKMAELISSRSSQALEMYHNSIKSHLIRMKWSKTEIDLVMDALSDDIIDAYNTNMTPVLLAEIIHRNTKKETN